MWILKEYLIKFYVLGLKEDLLTLVRKFRCHKEKDRCIGLHSNCCDRIKTKKHMNHIKMRWENNIFPHD